MIISPMVVVPASLATASTGGDLDRDGRALRRVVQATGRVCNVLRRARATTDAFGVISPEVFQFWL